VERGWGAPPTLGQFRFLDESGSIPVDAFEHPLPVVDVVEEGAELLEVDAPGSVRVEKLCTPCNVNTMMLNKPVLWILNHIFLIPIQPYRLQLGEVINDKILSVKKGMQPDILSTFQPFLGKYVQSYVAKNEMNNFKI